jgi:hypothetical protein
MDFGPWRVPCEHAKHADRGVWVRDSLPAGTIRLLGLSAPPLSVPAGEATVLPCFQAFCFIRHYILEPYIKNLPL